MDIDFSKLAVLILAVLPGYFALRSLKSYSPLSRQQKGATEELADFFAYGVLVHLILLPLSLLIWMHMPAVFKPLFSTKPVFTLVWSSTPSELKNVVSGLPALVIEAYLIASFFTGWVLGMVRGLWDSWKISKRFPRSMAWFRWVTQYHLDDRPLIYSALFPETGKNPLTTVVFVEVSMLSDKGIYSGQVIGFSILRDEEQHKLLYLADVWFKPAGAEKADFLGLEKTVLLDVCDASSIRVRQVDYDAWES